MSGDLHHYGFMAICPDLAGLRCSHRQRQPPVVAATQLGHQVGAVNMYRQEVCEVLRDWQASVGCPGVHGLPHRPQRSTLDQYAITLVWLAHTTHTAALNLIRDGDTPELRELVRLLAAGSWPAVMTS